MKAPLYLLLTCFALMLFQNSFSQAICGFDAAHNKKMKEDPDYRRNVLAGEASIRTYITNHPKLMLTPGSITPGKGRPPPTPLGSPPYTIPVAVPVIHTGGLVPGTYI